MDNHVVINSDKTRSGKHGIESGSLTGFRADGSGKDKRFVRTSHTTEGVKQGSLKGFRSDMTGKEPQS